MIARVSMLEMDLGFLYNFSYADKISNQKQIALDILDSRILLLKEIGL